MKKLIFMIGSLSIPLKYNRVYRFIKITLCSLLYVLIININSFGQSWNSIPGTNGTVYAMLYDNVNGYLYIGGDFTMVGGVQANRIARWDGNTWSPLGSGMNNTVRVLSFSSEYSNNIVAGGSFTMAGGINANRIALWNGTSWTPMTSGMNDIVCSLTLCKPLGFTTYLIAGGNFTTAGGINANRLAAWSGYWEAIGNGVNDTVFALKSIYPSTSFVFYAGGSFTMSGTSEAKRIGSFMLGGFSSQLGTGIDNGTVYALTFSLSSLYAGGSFTMIGGVTYNKIAKWSGNWSLVGTGTDNTIYSFYTTNTVPIPGFLCAGGTFTNAGGVSANRVAVWNGTTWSSLGTGMSGGSYPIVRAFSDFRMVLGAGGLFANAGGTNVSNIALWGSIPSAPSTVSPYCGATGQSLTPLLDWTDVSNAWRYGLQLSVNPNFNPLRLNITGLSTSQYTVPSGVLNNDTTYYWRVNAMNGLGTGDWSLICHFTTLLTGVPIYSNEIPKEFKLYQNYPNPFNPTTSIKIDIPKSYHSKLTIYNLLGREIAILINENYNAGSYILNWDASGIPSGIYFYKIETGSFTDIKRMVLIK
ncbi:MAG: T9SS type A sorting domain-containing protein [Ignavibacteria bacterium]|nr:T9SS type A sorting domain-containing protein [Ignavibacteria bacterium]